MLFCSYFVMEVLDLIHKDFFSIVRILDYRMFDAVIQITTFSPMAYLSRNYAYYIKIMEKWVMGLYAYFGDPDSSIINTDIKRFLIVFFKVWTMWAFMLKYCIHCLEYLFTCEICKFVSFTSLSLPVITIISWVRLPKGV